MWTVLTLLLVLAAAESTPADGSVTSAPEFQCPLDCVCKNVESVDCRGAGIRNISHVLRHQSVVKLNLAGNPLTSIDIEAFRHARLKSLSLQSTHLGHIPPRLFAHLPNLHTLRLDLNEIEELAPLSLQGLASLRHLRLDVNRMKSVPRAALSHLKQLEILNLNFNKIQSLPARIFENMTSLVALALDYNDIESIDDAAFEGLHSLKILELRHNQIKQLPNTFRTPLLHEL